MPKRKWSRTQQMWVIIVLCITIFGVSSLPSRSHLEDLLEGDAGAAIACGLCIILFEVWLRRVLGRRDTAITFLDRITSGDLSLSAREIADATRSERMASSLRALVSTSSERSVVRATGRDVVGAASRSAAVHASSRAARRNNSFRLTPRRRPSRRSIAPSRMCGRAWKTSPQMPRNVGVDSGDDRRASRRSAASPTRWREFVDETPPRSRRWSSRSTRWRRTPRVLFFRDRNRELDGRDEPDTEEIGKSAKQSSSLRSRSSRRSEGRQAVSGTVEGMGRIETAMSKRKARSMSSREVGEIGEIVRVIDEIAGRRISLRWTPRSSRRRQAIAAKPSRGGR